MVSPANVLWTSGWDSTYRVADLVLRQTRFVQPWYVQDSARRSTRTELQTIDRIRSELVAKEPSVADRLLPLRSVRLEKIPEDPAISAGFTRLAARGHLGGQYDWLARLAKWRNVHLELSIHADDKAHAFLEGHTVTTSDDVHRVAESAPADLDLFRWFTFPLFQMSKLDMQERALTNGFGDIMEMTWFCFSPLLDGRPCGFCNPCRFTREEGLGHRVPAPTIWRKMQYLAFFNSTRARHAARRVIGRR